MNTIPTTVFMKTTIGDKIRVKKEIIGETSKAIVLGFRIATVFGIISQKIRITKLTPKVETTTPHLAPKNKTHKLVVMAVAVILTTLFPNKIMPKKRSGFRFIFLTR